MSFQHHSEGMSPEMRKLFEDEQASRQRFQDQVDRRAKRTFSEGRLGAKELVEGLRESLQQVSGPAPAINAAARERWFREALSRLLEEHGAAIEVISDGGHLATSLIQVTMNGEWDGEYNQVRQFAQFVL